jgi:hypothetical protein
MVITVNLQKYNNFTNYAVIKSHSYDFLFYFMTVMEVFGKI